MSAVPTRRNRRKTKKNKNKRKGNNGNSSQMTLVVTRYNAPPRIKVRLQYSLYTSLTNAAMSFANITYNCSNPNLLTGSSNNVPGFTEYFNGVNSGFYQSYRVHNVNVRMQCVNLDATTAPRVVACFTTQNIAANSLGNSSTQNPYAVSPWSRQTELGISTGMSKGRINVSASIQQLYGANTFVNNDSFSTFIAGGASVVATTPIYLIVMILAGSALTTGVAISYNFTFDVEFYMRSNQAT